MPRASVYMIEGYTYHLTHRCHNRSFLMRFARDRDVYREWLREGARRHRVPVYGFCVTSSHAHVIVHVDSVDAVSSLMHLAAGSTAKQYNLRKDRAGSLWEHPYQCTLIEDGRHLLNCLCYVDMNMVRAGVVRHPREWRWSGYDELVGTRKRYRLLDLERLCESLGTSDPGELQKCYSEAIERRVAAGQTSREPQWTESLAVGSRDFIERISGRYRNRMKLDFAETAADGSGSTWMVKEPRTAYDSI